MPDAHVSLKGVTKVFGGAGPGSGVHALGPIDLDLRKGEFFAIVGPSGCGKSTLLEQIAGLNTPTQGEIVFEGKPIGNRVPDGIGASRSNSGRGAGLRRTAAGLPLTSGLPTFTFFSSATRSTRSKVTVFPTFSVSFGTYTLSSGLTFNC